MDATCIRAEEEFKMMRTTARPGLSWMLALGALFSAPACLAQQVVSQQPAGPSGEDVTALETVEANASAEPRSAFGRVMSIMIAALKQNADAPQADAPRVRPVALETARKGHASPSARPVHRIQVGAAFRLDTPTVAAESSSAPITP